MSRCPFILCCVNVALMFNVLFFNKVIASREINWQRLTFWIFWSFGCSSARFCWGCSRPDMNNIENLFSIYLWKYPFVSGGSGNKIQIPFTLGQLLAALSAGRGRRVYEIFAKWLEWNSLTEKQMQRNRSFYHWIWFLRLKVRYQKVKTWTLRLILGSKIY